MVFFRFQILPLFFIFVSKYSSNYVFSRAMSKDVIQNEKAVSNDSALGESGFENTNASAEPPAMQLTASNAPVQRSTGDTNGDNFLAGAQQATGHDLSDVNITYNEKSETAANGAKAFHTPGNIVTSESKSEFWGSGGTAKNELGHEMDFRDNGPAKQTGVTAAGNPLADNREDIADSYGDKAESAGKSLA